MLCLWWSLWPPAWSCQSPWHAVICMKTDEGRKRVVASHRLPPHRFISFIYPSIPPISQHVCLSFSPPDLLLSILQWCICLPFPPFFVFFFLFFNNLPLLSSSHQHYFELIARFVISFYPLAPTDLSIIWNAVTWWNTGCQYILLDKQFCFCPSTSPRYLDPEPLSPSFSYSFIFYSSSDFRQGRTLLQGLGGEQKKESMLSLFNTARHQCDCYRGFVLELFHFKYSCDHASCSDPLC